MAERLHLVPRIRRHGSRPRRSLIVWVLIRRDSAEVKEANAGGGIVAHDAWVQGLQFSWKEDEVNSRLHDILAELLSLTGVRP